MAKTQLVALDQDDRGVDRGLESLDPDHLLRDRTRRLEDLARTAFLAKRRDLEQQPRIHGQIQYTSCEGALETISERKRRSPERSDIARADRQLDQRERV